MKRLITACILLVLAVAIWAQERHPDPGFTGIIAADEAFDAISASQGVDKAFLACLADSAVVFRPHPVPAREWIVAHPSPKAFALRWTPEYAEAARSGDLGYTVGPYESRYGSGDTARVGHGYYLTIWETDQLGRWKAMVDGGVRVEKTLLVGRRAVQRRGKEQAGFAGTQQSDGSLSALLNHDQSVSAALGELPLKDAMSSLLSDDALVMRDLKGVCTGKYDVAGFLVHPAARMSTRVLGGGIASAGDLGFTYGEYHLKDGNAVLDGGYYVRIWRKESTSRWRVAVDLAISVPAMAKEER